MIARLIQFSLRQPAFIVGLACLLAAGGVSAFRAIPIDAFPDVTNVQVPVLTNAPGLSPIEVERFVTIPLEIQLTGMPGLAEVRSLSKFALSQITVVFRDDVDVYFARQLVLERLLEARERLPAGIEPVMAPVTTGLGEVYQYYLDGPVPGDSPAAAEAQLTDLRTIQDWVIRPLLKGVPGVIDVNSLGGFVKQYQVLVDPARLRKYNLALRDVFAAVANNNANAGGNILERHAEKAIIRGVGLIKHTADIETIVVKEEGGTPVFVRDVAEVRIGHVVRHGAAVLNGEREVVAGIVLMLRGANAKEVVEGVKARIAWIHESRILPEGIRIEPFYDRAELITAALATMRSALVEGITLIVLMFVLFLWHLRGALIAAANLILTPLVVFMVMGRAGLTANLMTLGGLAIAIGEIADGAVVVVENVYRHLSDPAAKSLPRRQVVRDACLEVARPIAFGILIVTVVFLPLVALEGIEGKMFKPLAYTMVIALVISLGLTLTLSPVLCLLISRGGPAEDLPLVRWLKRLYLPVLRWALAHRRLVVTAAVALVAATLALVPWLGREFVPILDEGAVTPQIVRLASVSLPESIEMEKRVQRALLEFPEVRMAVGKIGRSEIANAPEEPNESDPVVMLHPRETWTTASRKEDLVEAIRKRLARIPGISVLISQPIQERVDELISGIKTEVAIKLSGDDLDILKAKAEQIAAIMRTVRGVRDLRVEQIVGQPYLTVDIDRQKIARHGINVADIQEIISTAIGGKPATMVYEGERRFQLIVRFPEHVRNSVKAISDILVKDPAGAVIPMSELATIELREGPVRISREHLKRRVYIGFNIAGRDVAGVVAEGQRKLAEQLVLLPGYTLTWGGSFENMERAMARLEIVVPITVGLIFLLLFFSLESLRLATLIMLNLPFALVGGVLALLLTGEYLSVPASLGFISLFGVAVGNGLVLVTYIRELRREGRSLDEAVTTGCLLRLRPVLMTAMTTWLGLLPLAVAQGIGAEVQRPLAVVVIGGLLTSTALTLIVLPALYRWFEEAV